MDPKERNLDEPDDGCEECGAPTSCGRWLCDECVAQHRYDEDEDRTQHHNEE